MFFQEVHGIQAYRQLGDKVDHLLAFAEGGFHKVKGILQAGRGPFSSGIQTFTVFHERFPEQIEGRPGVFRYSFGQQQDIPVTGLKNRAVLCCQSLLALSGIQPAVNLQFQIVYDRFQDGSTGRFVFTDRGGCIR